MYIKPEIQSKTKDYILKKLIEFEQEKKIKIILAIESGSRAWGFPSVDSDYDIRFIYMRSIKDYLSIDELTDHLGIDILFDRTLGAKFDLQGWDVRKALRLAIKSNPVLVEWLVSPINYMQNDYAIALRDFAQENAHLEAFFYHYDRLARSSWEQIQQNSNEVKLKLYCYALRPVIAILWMLRYHKTPPMDLYSLCLDVLQDEMVTKEINNLIQLKAIAQEGDVIPRNYVLDSFIASTLENKVERYNVSSEAIIAATTKANNIFYKLIKAE
jgi:hypothetical protein